MKTLQLMMRIDMIIIALALLTILYVNVCTDTLDHNKDVIITHDMAMETCESMDLVYDYEAEGTTPEQYCIKG